MKLTLERNPHVTKKMAKIKGFGAVELVEGETEVFVRDGYKVITLGIGKKPLVRRKAAALLRRVVQLAKGHRIQTLHFDIGLFHKHVDGISAEALVETAVSNFELAHFEFAKYKSKKNKKEIKEIILVYPKPDEIKKVVNRTRAVLSEVNKCRVLANTPGGEMTPTLLADAAHEASRGTDVRVEVLSKGEMERLGMGAVLGVAQGSKEEPKFIIMEYMAGAASEKPVVLVGKGVTFDTGGLSLKPADAINDMHLDMSGGAAVIHAVVAAARLKLKKNVVGIVPAVENMPSGSSYRPGDILRSMSGKTIEVLNTDAEGRIILADALTYAKRYKPRLVVDVATLTGAALHALGQRASAVFTADYALGSLLVQLGEESGDYVWPLPLWDEFEKEIQGTFGDVANIGKVRYGGAIQGAVFLWQFAKGLPLWAHIDIAPRMIAADDEYLAKGAVGAPVRLLVKLLERF